MTTIKCNTCGNDINLSEGQTHGICSRCGNTSMIETMDTPACETSHSYHSENINTISRAANTTAFPSMESLYKRAILFLEDGDFAQANEYFDRILDVDPEYAPAYIGKLQVSQKVRLESNLKHCSSDFDRDSNYQKAIRFATPAQRTVYESYNAAIRERNDFARREQEQRETERKTAEEQARIAAKRRRRRVRKICAAVFLIIALPVSIIALYTQVFRPNAYTYAVNAVKNGDYDKAAKLFTFLGDYKDAATQAQESQYQKGAYLLKTGDYAGATAAFKSVTGYRDASAQALESQYQQILSNEKLPEAYSSKIATNKAILNACTIGLNADGSVSTAGLPPYAQGKINAWTHIVDMAANEEHIIGLRADGRVFAQISEDYGQYDISKWTDIISLAIGEYHTVGLKSSGTLVAAGNNEDHPCDVDTWSDIIAVETVSSITHSCTVGLKSDGTVVITKDRWGSSKFDINGWTDIVSITAGDSHVAGLKSDGTVIATGYNNDGQCNTDGWTNIVSVDAGRSFTAGLKSDGTVVISGSTKDGLSDAESWTDITEISAGAYHIVGLKSDGTAVAAGWNYTYSCDVEDWSDICAIAAGDCTLGLKKDGSVIIAGANEYIQDSLGSLSDITDIFAGENRIALLKSDGSILTMQLDDYGQRNIDSWRNIAAVSVGKYHTVGLKSNGTVVATGDNSNYQCEVGSWRNITAVAGGDDYTLGLKSDGTVVITESKNWVFPHPDGDYTIPKDEWKAQLAYWSDVAAINIMDNGYPIALKSDGTILTVSNSQNDDFNTESWTDIVSIFTGNHLTAGLKSDGTVIAHDEEASVVEGWTDIVSVSVGYNHTVALKSDGSVVAAGNNERGQCDVESWTDIVAVEANYAYSIGLKSDGTLVTAGGTKYDDAYNVGDWDLF